MVAASVASTDAYDRKERADAQSTYEDILMKREMGPSQSEINQYAKAYDIDPADAEKDIINRQNQEFLKAERILFPEKAEARVKAIAEGLNPEWSEEQQDFMRGLAGKSRQIAEAFTQDGGWAEVERAVLEDPSIPSEIKEGWIELSEAGGAAADSNTPVSSGSVYTQPLVDLWSMFSSGESAPVSATTRRQVRDK
jgi:hypothetical protein